MSNEHLALMVRESVKKNGDAVAMRFKKGTEWQPISYTEMGEQILATAKGLLTLNVAEGDMVGIFSENRPEWAIADFAILSLKGVSVPVYATNTDKQTEYIVNDAQIKVLFVGDKAQYSKVLSFADSSKYLEKIIVFDDSIELQGNKSLHLSQFMKTGKESGGDEEIEKRLSAASVDDLATLIYTSGTTGDPKGVMLTHKNFSHQFKAIENGFSVEASDRSLCFLPLSHAYERTWSYYVFRTGAQNNYLANPKEIVEYMSDVKPTAMVSVPRLYEKIYSTVFDRLEKAPGSKKKLFYWALKVGKKYAYKRKDNKMVGPYLKLRHNLADKLVLGKIRDIVGGYKKFFSAGGAALSSEIEEFFLAAGVLVCQGYGLTETSPMITANAPGAFKFGTVGRPVLNCEVKISDEGEILAKGDNIMKGYYNKPDATAEVFDNDGWFKSGDVGIIDEDGYVKITDRIKDLIITSGGKNIAPQRIEMAVGMDHYIEQIATIGDGRKFISALIVPNFEALEEYAKDQGISFSSTEELLKKEEITDFYNKRIKDQSADLAGYEKIKAFSLIPNEFSQEGGELTPTMKIKRKVIKEKYKEIIDAMYPAE
ncbi:MAG: long-chain fatty acid--CoA ligase [bacterium]|nr:long-chain fatty acid--CoA ligase [bacterium]MCP4133991.1 long-chain fatty acid--CoA ligase [bacterium]